MRISGGIASSRDEAPPWLGGAVCVLLIATLWMATRPYEGVVQDTRYYVVEALRLILPGRFADDFYFRSGSQGNFTIFPWIYAFAIGKLWIGHATLLLTLLCDGLWLGGLVFLAWGLFDDQRPRLAAVVAAIVLPGMEIGHGYAESFLTPRLPTEALVLWALGCMFRGRNWCSLGLLAVAMAVHPLTALPGLALLALRQVLRRPWWWAVYLVIALGGIGAALLGIQPFARLIERFDSTWFAVVLARNGYCLATQGGWDLWLRVGCTLTLWAVGYIFGLPRERRLLVELLSVGGIAFGTSFFGGDILHDVLIVDLQLTRWIWLVSLLANLFVGGMMLRAPPPGVTPLSRIFMAAALACLALANLMSPAIFAAPPMVVAGGGGLILERCLGRPMPLGLRLVIALVFGAAIGVLLLILFQFAGLAVDSPPKFREILRGMALVAGGLGGMAVLARLAPACRRARFVPLLAVSLVLASLAAASQDWRTEWSRFVETTPAAPASLISLLPAEGQIYWEGDVDVPWFVLSRPSYFSCTQGAGVLFFRGTALDFQHRYDSFLPLRTYDFDSDPYCRAPPGPSLPATAGMLREICRDNPGLSALVLLRAVPGARGTIWTAPATEYIAAVTKGHLSLITTRRFHIYRCDAF